MASVTEIGYIFFYSQLLSEDDIDIFLKDFITKANNDNLISDSNIKYKINVVCNRDDQKLGYSYIWVNNEELFNLLLGLNPDGSERVEYHDDPDWEPQEENEDEDNEEDKNDSWYDTAVDEDKSVCPQIPTFLDPLILNDTVYCSETGMEVMVNFTPLGLNSTRLKSNQVFSKNLPDWITKSMILDKFSMFERDTRIIYNDKKKTKFRYPIVKIRKEENGNYCTINFSSMYPNTASFMINMMKKVMFEQNGEKKLIFFSQSKR